MSIQKVTLPNTLHIKQTHSIKTPIGMWQGIENGGGYADGQNSAFTINFLDQIRPLFETFFN